MNKKISLLLACCLIAIISQAQPCIERKDSSVTICMELTPDGSNGVANIGEVPATQPFTVVFKVQNQTGKDVKKITLFRRDMMGTTKLINIPPLAKDAENSVVTIIRNRNYGVNFLSWFVTYKIGRKERICLVRATYKIVDTRHLKLEVKPDKSEYEKGEAIGFHWKLINDGPVAATIIRPAFNLYQGCNDNTMDLVLVDTFHYIYHRNISETYDFDNPPKRKKNDFGTVTMKPGDTLSGAMQWHFGDEKVGNRKVDYHNLYYRTRGSGISEDLTEIPVGYYAILMAMGYDDKKAIGTGDPKMVWSGKITSNLARIHIVKPKKK